MKHRLVTGLTALALAAAGVVVAPAAPTGATPTAPPPDHSIMRMLDEDGHHTDANWQDFDIYEKLVREVLAARPHSELGVLSHPARRVTAFMPTDAAFRHMARSFTGHRYATELQVFRHVQAAPVVIESHLLYGIVGGHTLTHRHLLAAAPTAVTTLQGGHLRIRDRDGHLVLKDFYRGSPDSTAPWRLADLNQGHRQIAHGITQVLSPLGQK